MNVSYPPEAESFRAEVRAFLRRALPDHWRGLGALDGEQARAFTETWRATLAAEGYLTPSWPPEYGGAGLSRLQQLVLVEELATAGVPFNGRNDNFSIKMIGNLLLRYGTDEQKSYFLPRIVSGEHRWCQGFSETEAGSDLAGLRTRARAAGDEWVIDGQKIWTSDALTANWIFLLARTDLDAERHRGITMLLVPMDQSGIEVRPIRMMSGAGAFNQVTFDGARTALDNVVIGPGEGYMSSSASCAATSGRTKRH